MLLEGQKIWIKENNLSSDSYKVLDKVLTQKLRKKWREIFIPNVGDKKILHKCPACAKENIRSYDWHVFSYGIVKAKRVSGNFLKEKLASYQADIYLIWEECNSSGLLIDSNILKNCRWTNTDIYVFDSTFKWTFVVTHEGWFYYVGERINEKISL